MVFALEPVVLEMRAFPQDDFSDRVCKGWRITVGHEAFYQRGRTVFLGYNKQSRETSIALRVCISDERYLHRRFEFYILWNPQKQTRLQQSRIQGRQPVVVITRVTRQILANDLVVSCVAGRAKEIDCD